MTGLFLLLPRHTERRYGPTKGSYVRLNSACSLLAHARWRIHTVAVAHVEKKTSTIKDGRPSARQPCQQPAPFKASQWLAGELQPSAAAPHLGHFTDKPQSCSSARSCKAAAIWGLSETGPRPGFLAGLQPLTEQAVTSGFAGAGCAAEGSRRR